MNPGRCLSGLFFVAAVLLSPFAFAKTQFVTIGTGGMTGVYYPTGGAIAKMVNHKRDAYHIKASVESTAGSVYNINAVLSGDLQLGIAQSDLQFQAYKGQGEWKSKGPQTDLRAVLSFHSEVVTLVAADDANINSLKDLKGKRVNIGSPGSAQRVNATAILKEVGLDVDKDMQAESLKPSEAPKMLQDGRIDAFFYIVGHPSGAITEATSGARKVHFVPVTGVDKLLAASPYLAKAEVPVDLYPMATNKAPVASVGVKATLVSAKKVSDEIIYAFTKEIFENLDEFKKVHPAFARLTKKEMLEGLSAPVHPGAEKYYKEVKLSLAE